MKHFLALFATAVAFLGLAGSTVRADTDWYYQTIATNSAGTSNVLWVNQPSPGLGSGGIEMLGPTSGFTSGNRDVTLTNLRAFSVVPGGVVPERFNNVGYALSLTIMDVTTRAFGTVTFAGVLNGRLSQVVVDLQNSYTSIAARSIQLGEHVYTVSLGHFAMPGAPYAGVLGHITASVTVSPVAQAPGPSSLLLGGLGCAVLGLASWRKRRLAQAA